MPSDVGVYERGQDKQKIYKASPVEAEGVECKLWFSYDPRRRQRASLQKYKYKYNPSSQSGVERSVDSLKHLFKRSANMNQLQFSEMVFDLNTRVQPKDTGSPILRF